MTQLAIFVRTMTHQELQRRVRATWQFKRHAVNYIRHICTDYDLFMNSVKTEKAKQCIRDAVFAEIAAAYPYLATECTRQLNAKQR